VTEKFPVRRLVIALYHFIESLSPVLVARLDVDCESSPHGGNKAVHHGDVLARLLEHMDDVMLSQFELEGAAGEDRVLVRREDRGRLVVVLHGAL
jgi:hypothetical protein